MAADDDSILLHPDALHCLKRKQLVSLCRRLDIKANGKSADLIHRLQHFAAANISPNSPTRGNLALLRHVKRSRPSYQEAPDSDDDDADNLATSPTAHPLRHRRSPSPSQPPRPPPPAPDAAAEIIAIPSSSQHSEPSQSLRRSPRKRNINSSIAMHSDPPAPFQPTQPLRQSTKGPRPFASDPVASSSKAGHRPSSAQAQVADLSLDIDRMLRDIHSPEPAEPDVQDCSMDVQGQTPTLQVSAAAQQQPQQPPLEPFMAEFGSMAAMDIVGEASRPASASVQSKASSTSSPWKTLSGSLKGLKNGLQRMGSLSKGGGPKKAAGEKRRREDVDVGSKHDQDSSSSAQDLADEPADCSMPGAFDGSMLASDGADAEAAAADGNGADDQRVGAGSQTQPLRIIKPRPSRSRASLAPSGLSMVAASPSKLYPDLSRLASSPAGPRTAPTTASAALPSMPSITNHQFTAATESILADLNARLAAKGLSTTSLSTLGGVGQWGGSTTSLGDLGLSKGKSTRFDDDHERQFGRMDSIANHYAAKRSRQAEAGSVTPSASGVDGRIVPPPPRSAKHPARIVSGPSSSSLAASSGAQRGAAMSTATSSKRIRVSEDPNRPGLRPSASGRLAAAPTMQRSTTATSVSSLAQRELHKKRLELARQRRLSKGGATGTASKTAGAAAKDRGRLERIKMGIRGMLHGGSGGASAAPAGGAANTDGSAVTKRVDAGSIGSTKSAVSAASAASASSTKTSGGTLAKKKPGFDLKASLSRKPSTLRAPSTAAPSAPNAADRGVSQAVTRPSTATAMADRLRTQGWTGSSSATLPAARQHRPTSSSAREFGSVRTNTSTSTTTASAAAAAAAATAATRGIVGSGSTTSVSGDAQKKTLLKAAKPVAGAVKRARVQPDRLLQRKREAIAQAAVRTTMLASSSSMDLARKLAASATADDEGRTGVRQRTLPSVGSGSVNGLGGGGSAAVGAVTMQAGSTAPRKISTRTLSNASCARGSTSIASASTSTGYPGNVNTTTTIVGGGGGGGATTTTTGKSVAEQMRTARLAELRARNRATEAGIGLGRTTPSPTKPSASSTMGGAGGGGGITASNRYTLLCNSPSKLAAGAGAPTLTPRSSSLRNLRRMMRNPPHPPSSSSSAAATGAATTRGASNGLRNMFVPPNAPTSTDGAAAADAAAARGGGIRLVKSYERSPVPTPTASPTKVETDMILC
ncbi:uncharacterized protein PFL1_06711 [Pseudozyma flocculosa PF-1]|uniref:SAP domain-containing protein n=2 Tax=Pseudozyma flocculosa TaxID=84751 RepID=A0A5C3F5G4_9BASI|nr:uncharacterized protein PFL1_06711 [Pseudozyma flocculosa PF-1]EPQ25717.1 hypothetical protein PFL1_06711 [Pseudozyma flocculosa PF-1]SPO38907.1 uncharacterized protein PSFLO_04386 [Pseudozyma flocculosa]